MVKGTEWVSYPLELTCQWMEKLNKRHDKYSGVVNALKEGSRERGHRIVLSLILCKLCTGNSQCKGPVAG